MDLPPGTSGTGVQQTLETTKTFSAYLPPIQPDRIYRVVGYSEYAESLSLLDNLVSMASREELQAIDEVIRKYDHYKVYTNLSRGFAVRSSLARLPNSGGDDFARHGLAWVMALARVEVGAALAGFTQHPRPFEGAASSISYDAQQYRELLRDGAQVHYWTLYGNPDFHRVLRRFTPTSTTLAYIRRLNIAIAFTFEVGRRYANELSPVQLAELRQQAKNLVAARAALEKSVNHYLASQYTQRSTAAAGQRVILELCQQEVCVNTDPPFWFSRP